MTTTLDILKRARALIEDPARWTRREYARDISGKPVGIDAAEATCWCAMGALAHVSTDRFWMGEPYNALRTAMGNSVADFNDGCTHAEMLGAFDAAIASEEARRAD